jgi:hypothetical protein
MLTEPRVRFNGIRGHPRTPSTSARFGAVIMPDRAHEARPDTPSIATLRILPENSYCDNYFTESALTPVSIEAHRPGVPLPEHFRGSVHNM